MPKLDVILLGVFISLPALAAILLFVRHRQLAHGQRLWMRAALANRAAVAAPMPQAAETIKLSNFERVRDQRDKSAEEVQDLVRQLRDARHEQRESDEVIRLFSDENKRLERQLQEEKAKNLRLDGLYTQAELERQRLALENQRFREERRTTVN